MTKFYYSLSPEIIQYIASISEKIGAVNAHHLNKQSPQEKRQNRIKILHSSLINNGYKIREEELDRLIDRKKFPGETEKEKEIINIIGLYDQTKTYIPFSETSLLNAYQHLSSKTKHAGYRILPIRFETPHLLKQIPAKQVPQLMSSLFDYLQNSTDLLLLKSCFFYYQMEMIQPFDEKNAFLAGYWQKRILLEDYPVFDYLIYNFSFNNITFNPEQYKFGDATPYIIHMLEIIDQALGKVLNFKHRILTDLDRIFYFLEIGVNDFNRRDYMITFKEISSATASRDLKKALLMGCITKYGEKNQTRYKIK